MHSRAVVWTRALLSIGLLLAFAWSKWSARPDKTPILTGDGRSWALVAESSIASREFWFGSRPFTLPLIYKLAEMSEERVVLFQSVLGVVAWGFFATCIAKILPKGFRTLVPLSLVLLTGLSLRVLEWDSVIRSESLAISFLVASVGCAVRVLLAEGSSRSGWVWVGGALLFGVLSAFARDANGYFFLIFPALVIAPWLLLSQPSIRARVRRQGLAMGLGMVLIAVGGSINTRESGRYAFPLINVVLRRVLKNPEKLAYFRDELGLPVSRALKARAGKFASADHRYVYRSPELAAFRNWIYERGYAGYQRYLLSHPGLTWAEAADYMPRLVEWKAGRLASKSANPTSTKVDAALNELCPPKLAWSVVAGLVASGAFMQLLRMPRARLLGLLTAAFAILAGLQCYVVFHGDDMEIGRHGVLVPILLNLGCVLWICAWWFVLSEGLIALFARGGGHSARRWMLPSWRLPDLVRRKARAAALAERKSVS
ncbi:MAG TPA: hypothetical protein VFQ61_07055 [Polyangiaceae bacterium]|nr:hypothetical protein [Polyangiaceae bacterium]